MIVHTSVGSQARRRNDVSLRRHCLLLAVTSLDSTGYHQCRPGVPQGFRTLQLVRLREIEDEEREIEGECTLGAISIRMFAF